MYVVMSKKLFLKRKWKRFWQTKHITIPKGVLYGAFACFGLVLLLLVVDTIFLPKISLKGKKVVVLNYQDRYVEKGYTAKYLGNDITKRVKVSGKVNSKKLGEYEIVYTVREGMFKKTVTRTVLVKDKTKPKLEINSDDIYVCPGDELVPEKVKATDNYDGDLSKKVENIISHDAIIYRVKDSSGNVREVEKKVLYQDIVSPEIILNGSNESYLYIGDQYEEAGYTVSDNCDEKLEEKVEVSGEVNPSVVGEYLLTYKVQDQSGNQQEVTRKVFVRERNKNGTIYLTFDDGPNSGTTNVILDILMEEGVKATFFVTNRGPDELIKREFDEGHTVALHTASHDYAIVYASDESYFNDLYSVQDRVKRITGMESKIIRFPGGSSNTISRRYSEGIMTRLTQEVQNRGFKYYDWNLSSGDAAGGQLDSSTIYNNVVSNLRKDRVNMVLMHDIKSYTRDALRDIIHYGKENGYVFEPITMETEMITQRVNN